jgi:hypothetical protein
MLEWMGHEIRMDETSEANNNFESKPEGRRQVGRTKFRCLEDEENYITELKIKRWRLKTNEREERTSDLAMTYKKGSSAIFLYLIQKIFLGGRREEALAYSLTWTSI